MFYNIRDKPFLKQWKILYKNPLKAVRLQMEFIVATSKYYDSGDDIVSQALAHGYDWKLGQWRR